MAKLLVVDDEEAVRRLIRLNLMDCYEVVDTGEPEQALALALEHKPDAILLDLRMPRYSGFELCQTFRSFSATQLIPVFVISGEAGSKTKEFCRDLGVVGYFEKPVDFDALRQSLETFLKDGRKERRSEVRVRLRVPLRLSGNDEKGEPFTLLTTTENISRSSFLCSCGVALLTNTTVGVQLVGPAKELAGKARVVRSEWHETPYLATHSTLLRSRITGYWIGRVRDGMESHPSQGLAMARRGVGSRVKLGTPWFDTHAIHAMEMQS